LCSQPWLLHVSQAAPSPTAHRALVIQAGVTVTWPSVTAPHGPVHKPAPHAGAAITPRWSKLT
jgi:hypothetical protein